MNGNHGLAERPRRLADERIASALKRRGAVLVCGPKGCGKRAAALKACGARFSWDDDGGARELAALLDASDAPVLVEGWQSDAQRWDDTARAVLETGRTGRAVMTCDGEPFGGGRHAAHARAIARIDVGPLSSLETGLSDGSFSVARLLDIPGIADDGYETAPGVDERRLAEALIRGGLFGGRGGVADMPSFNGEEGLFAGGIARFSGELATNLAICRSLTPSPDEDVRLRFAAFQERLVNGRVLGSRPNWRPTKLLESRFSCLPRRYFCDPSLAAAALGVDGAAALLADKGLLAKLFKTLVMRDVSAYAAMHDLAVFRYDDKDGMQFDLVLERGSQWCAAAVVVDPEDVEPTAQRLVRTAQYLEGYRTPKPCSLTVISGPGSCGTVLNGVRVIPFDRLGA